jgi:4-amino-4-deoxychorismate lyase
MSAKDDGLTMASRMRSSPSSRSATSRAQSPGHGSCGQVTLLAVAVAGRGIVEPDEPVLHADDEALLRGRAAFETMRVYGGVPFRLDEHLRRLAGSAARIGLQEVDARECEELARTALEHAQAQEAVLRVYWTAGREGEGRATVVAIVSAIPPQIEEMRSRGISLISLPLGLDPNLRAVAPWLLGGVKSTSYAVNMAAEAEARRRGADDAVFLAAGDIVLEGPVTNVWWRRANVLYTPALELGILAGVTRATLIAEAAALEYEVREGAFPLAHLAEADEAFTSSTVREVLSVLQLDGAPLGPGSPGEAATQLQQALRRVATTSDPSFEGGG